MAGFFFLNVLALILIQISLPYIGFHKEKKINEPEQREALSDFDLCIGLLRPMYKRCWDTAATSRVRRAGFAVHWFCKAAIPMRPL